MALMKLRIRRNFKISKSDYDVKNFVFLVFACTYEAVSTKRGSIICIMFFFVLYP